MMLNVLYKLVSGIILKLQDFLNDTNKRDMNGKMEEERLKAETGAESKSDGGEQKSIDEMSREELAVAHLALRGEAERNRDLYLRSMADVDNIKKRTAKDKEDWVKYANENLLKSLLPVIDNLEKAIEHTRDESSMKALAEGLELTLKGFKDSLGKSGVTEVPALGVPFDPRVHEAVYEVNDDQTPDGIVVQELQKGYTLNGRLLRPAIVVVCKGRGCDSNRDEIPQEGQV
jgi:molecular chaperone GrpE